LFKKERRALESKEEIVEGVIGHKKDVFLGFREVGRGEMTDGENSRRKLKDCLGQSEVYNF